MPDLECKCPYCGKPITLKVLTEDQKELEEFQEVINEIQRLSPSRAYDLLMDYAKKMDSNNKTDRFAKLFITWLGTRAKQNIKVEPNDQEKGKKVE